MKKWITLLKIAAAALTALIALDLFCAWYYNPTAYEWDDFRATDAIRTPGAFTSRATEGVAGAIIDENGYNNAAIPGEDGVSVLMMGSSHTEALNVPQEQSATAVLNRLLQADGTEGCAYNIGISSHRLTRNAANLPRALQRFQPKDFVVIETSELVFSYYTVESAIADRLPRMARTEVGLPAWITDRPLSRALYRQFSTWFGGAEEESGVDLDLLSADTYADYEAILTELFAQMKTACDAYGVDLIVYYHPHLTLQPDGSAASDANQRCLDTFVAAADNAGVTFLDMTDAFLSAYAADHTLPHGFSNTAPGVGHLNADGHALIARELYEAICERRDAA